MDDKQIDKITTMKIRKSTAASLKEIASYRMRRESHEQVILELIHAYNKARILNAGN